MKCKVDDERQEKCHKQFIGEEKRDAASTGRII